MDGGLASALAIDALADGTLLGWAGVKWGGKSGAGSVTLLIESRPFPLPAPDLKPSATATNSLSIAT